eukprot:COSAG01_NODE_13913_length_1518_cov_2.556025_1_plen_119_part_00
MNRCNGCCALRAGNSSRPHFGTLTPSSYSQNGRLTYTALADPAGDYLAVHFYRPGQWAIPMPRSGASLGSISWVIRRVDYWGMEVRPAGAVDASQASAVVDVATTPANFEFVRAGRVW